ncbi:MAG: hypothetical protein AAB890_02455 [Patescibacteria group bacterium]|mgnify:CR=1 FL=1
MKQKIVLILLISIILGSTLFSLWLFSSNRRSFNQQQKKEQGLITQKLKIFRDKKESSEELFQQALVLYGDKNNIEDSVNLFRKAIKLEPSPVQQAVVKSYLGLALYRHKDINLRKEGVSLLKSVGEDVSLTDNVRATAVKFLATAIALDHDYEFAKKYILTVQPYGDFLKKINRNEDMLGLLYEYSLEFWPDTEAFYGSAYYLYSQKLIRNEYVGAEQKAAFIDKINEKIKAGDNFYQIEVDSGASSALMARMLMLKALLLSDLSTIREVSSNEAIFAFQNALSMAEVNKESMDNMNVSFNTRLSFAIFLFSIYGPEYDQSEKDYINSFLNPIIEAGPDLLNIPFYDLIANEMKLEEKNSALKKSLNQLIKISPKLRDLLTNL